ncbi:MAG: AsmA family protein, partial [Alphaproteobacteria bacterium]|nr:AsmA family protein [Alphaproteobacteria bacterium]
MKKKILHIVAVLVVAVIGAVLVVPGLIDWNDYKDEIAARVRAATGREATIKGDIRLSLLPAPALSVADVSLASIPGAKDPHPLRLKRLEARVALAPLLSGQIRVETVRLLEPVLILETLADGRQTWNFTGAQPVSPQPAPARPDANRAATPAPGPAIHFDNVRVENGTVIVRDARTGAEEKIEAISARVTAASLEGPFEGAGAFRARGLTADYIVSLGRLADEKAVPLNFSLTVAGTRLQASGTLSALAQAPRFRGKMKIEGQDLAALLAAAEVGDANMLPLARPFLVEGAVTATAALTEIKDIDVR